MWRASRLSGYALPLACLLNHCNVAEVIQSPRTSLSIGTCLLFRFQRCFPAHSSRRKLVKLLRAFSHSPTVFCLLCFIVVIVVIIIIIIIIIIAFVFLVCCFWFLLRMNRINYFFSACLCLCEKVGVRVVTVYFGCLRLFFPPFLSLSPPPAPPAPFQFTGFDLISN